MEKLINFDLVQNFLQVIADWFSSKFFVFDSIYQIIIIFIVFLAASLLAKPLRRLLHKIPDNNKVEHFFHWFTSLDYLIFPLFCFIMLKFASGLPALLSWKSPILTIASSITTAWLLIRIINHVLKQSLWIKVLGMFVWFLAIINSLQLQTEFIKLLESVALDLGEVHLSLYTIIRLAVALFVSIWLASKLVDYLNKRITSSSSINPAVKVLLSKFSKLSIYGLAAIITLQVIGVKLSSLAVMGGAIGVGVGFGLQRIVSNMISGVLLLLDKSLKPGDVIEIEGTMGWIKNMSTRHITLQTISGKEHLIPNEDLITKNVINWSYSNKLIMLTIPVGVSYESDIKKAMRLITQAAEKNTRVLKRPAPNALMMDFADSSINLESRFWINDPEKGIDNIKSDIRLAIWDLFNENEITIPFPQQDIHIKTMATKQ